MNRTASFYLDNSYHAGFRFIEVHNILRFKETLTVLEELHLKAITLLEPEGLGGKRNRKVYFGRV